MSYGVVLFGPAEAAPQQDLWVRRLATLTGGPVRTIHAEWGWALRGTSERDRDQLRSTVRAWSDEIAGGSAAADAANPNAINPSTINVAIVPPALVAAPPGLVVTDVDSTLTTTEAIDLLAERAGAGAQVAAVTERAMRGELDFADSLRQRVATLRGLPVEVVHQVIDRVQLSAGASDLVAAVHRWGGRIGVVSGGFTPLVEPLATRLGLDAFLANDLEVEDGLLTGRVAGAVVDPDTKRATLTHWAAGWDVPLASTVAIGDGANDLPMIHAAGLGIAYRAKPLVVQQAPAAISFARLDAALALIEPWQ